MLRDLEVLAIPRIVSREIRPWFILFKKAFWAKFVYDFIGQKCK